MRNGKSYIDKVFHGDIFKLLEQLPDGSVDMIFGDPDYNVGIKYNTRSYTRSFEEYVDWYVNLARESLRVLKKDGNLFLINYPKQNAYLRVKYLDKAAYEVHDYSWVYNTNVGHSPKRFTTAHRSILHARKSTNNKFYKDQVAVPYQNPTDRRIRQNLANGSKGRMPYSWLYYNLVKNVSREKTYHSCQIPQALTELLMKASTKPGDSVLVLIGGSGAEVTLCQQMGRHFLTAELDEKYCRMIEERLASNGKIPQKYKLILGSSKSQTHPKLFEETPPLFGNLQEKIG
jgi:DNA modification methylase